VSKGAVKLEGDSRISPVTILDGMGMGAWANDKGAREPSAQTSSERAKHSPRANDRGTMSTEGVLVESETTLNRCFWLDLGSAVKGTDPDGRRDSAGEGWSVELRH
jgi:hypothetical protein